MPYNEIRHRSVAGNRVIHKLPELFMPVVEIVDSLVRFSKFLSISHKPTIRNLRRCFGKNNKGKMKFKLTLIVLVFSSNLFATDFGMKVGINYSTLGGKSDKISPQYIPHLHFGFVSILPIANKIDLQIELLYDTYGYKFTTAVYNSTGIYSGEKEITFSYKYLNMPLMFSIHFLEFENDRGNIYLGSNLAYLINATSNIEFDRDPNYPEDNTNKIDYGILIGTNFIINIAENKFIIDARYYFSLNAIEKNEEWDRGHHKSISLSLGYLW